MSSKKGDDGIHYRLERKPIKCHPKEKSVKSCERRLGNGIGIKIDDWTVL